MDKLRSHAKLEIHVENENLIMYGVASESAGCVLRGVVCLQLLETTKIKSIALALSGKMTVSWTEGKQKKKKRFICLFLFCLKLKQRLKY